MVDHADEVEDYMLSTSDNPFNPYTHWNEWYAYDTEAGYHTTEYLGRVVKSSYELSQPLQDRDIQEGIEEILHYNLTGNYVKVYPPKNTPS